MTNTSISAYERENATKDLTDCMCIDNCFMKHETTGECRPGCYLYTPDHPGDRTPVLLDATSGGTCMNEKVCDTTFHDKIDGKCPPRCEWLQPSQHDAPGGVGHQIMAKRELETRVEFRKSIDAGNDVMTRDGVIPNAFFKMPDCEIDWILEQEEEMNATIDPRCDWCNRVSDDLRPFHDDDVVDWLCRACSAGLPADVQ